MIMYAFIPVDVIQIKKKIDELNKQLETINDPLYYKSINENRISFINDLNKLGWDILWYDDPRGVKKIKRD